VNDLAVAVKSIDDALRDAAGMDVDHVSTGGLSHSDDMMLEHRIAHPRRL